VSDRFVPVAVAVRDGYGFPLEVFIPGRQICPLYVLDDRNRVVGQVEMDGAANWIGTQGPQPRHSGTQHAPAAEARHIARSGRITARLDDKRNVIGLRISRTPITIKPALPPPDVSEPSPWSRARPLSLWPGRRR